jgi:hypothetical protein
MPRFHLDADVLIDRPLDEVRAFFADPDSAVRWDRSVSKVICTSPFAAGATFTTIGPFRRGREGKRSDYRVLAVHTVGPVQSFRRRRSLEVSDDA